MEYPGVGVGVFVWMDGKILLLKRTSRAGYGKWCVPGGRLEWHETPEDAAHREVHEEAGIAIKNMRFIGYTNDIIPDVDWHFVTLFYNAEITAGEARIAEPDKFSELQWCAPNKLPMPLLDCEVNYIKKFGLPKE